MRSRNPLAASKQQIAKSKTPLLGNLQFAVCIIIFSLGFSVTAARAQGRLPFDTAIVETSSVTHNPLLIGDTVPETLTVTGDSGQARTLMSYKTALDILVVGFFSARCEMNRMFWPSLRRLNEAYKEWHVSFVAVSAPPQETLPELAQLLIRERLAWPAARDDHQAVVRRLRATYTPEVAIIDEFGALRYRGSATEAGKALETLIGHIDPIANPEPSRTGECALP